MDVVWAAHRIADGKTVYSRSLGWAYKLNGVGGLHAKPDGGERRHLGMGIRALLADDWELVEENDAG